MRNLAILSVLVCIFLVQIVYAEPSTPLFPMLFNGTVSIDGNPAPIGMEIVAKIEGVEKGNLTTSEVGKYGDFGGPGPELVVSGNATDTGKTINFFIKTFQSEYISADENSTFVSDKKEELNLTFPPFCGDSYCNNGESCSSCSHDCGSCPAPAPTGGGYTGGGGGYTCTENWSCTDWSDCSPEGLQTSTCTDSSNCGSNIGKPPEEQSCIYTPPQLPVICSAGARVCAGNDLMECYEGNNWIKVETCQHGCSDAQCNPEPEEEPEENITGDAGEGAGEGEPPAPGVGLTGYLIANPAVMFFSIVVIIIFVLGGAIYWKVKP